MYIRTRNDLIKFIEDSRLCDLYPRIRRAIINGTNENLGSFSTIPCTPANTTSGLIVWIKSTPHDWIIAVKPGQFEDYKCYILRKIPWKFWEGDKAKNPLYHGDHPEKYKLLRYKELQDAETKEHGPNKTG